MIFGGRVAEEIIFGKENITSGASNDILQATQRKSMSDETAKLIDHEIRKFIDNAESHARKILKKNLKHLHNLAKALLEFETLSGDDVKELISKGKLKSNNKNSDGSKP